MRREDTVNGKSKHWIAIFGGGGIRWQRLWTCRRTDYRLMMRMKKFPGAKQLITRAAEQFKGSVKHNNKYTCDQIHLYKKKILCYYPRQATTQVPDIFNQDRTTKISKPHRHLSWSGGGGECLLDAARTRSLKLHQQTEYV
jgi:hypothetical protein